MLIKFKKSEAPYRSQFVLVVNTVETAIQGKQGMVTLRCHVSGHHQRVRYQRAVIKIFEHRFIVLFNVLQIRRA